MDAEQIVRALAAIDRLADGRFVCLMCGKSGFNNHGVHAVNCPWRLAREYVGLPDHADFDFVAAEAAFYVRSR